MTRIRVQISTSLDGFVAGPRQGIEDPLGVGGLALHEWLFELAAWRRAHGLEGGEDSESSHVVEESLENVGATVMGRGMFGGGDGPWGPWRGWWGSRPPFRMPVFVLTHHQREPLELDGTTFHFVDGVERAYKQAVKAARGKDIALAGGADVVRQFIAAGLVDEIWVNVVPLLLGDGTRLFDGLSGVRLELVRTVETPGVVHLKYRVAS